MNWFSSASHQEDWTDAKPDGMVRIAAVKVQSDYSIFLSLNQHESLGLRVCIALSLSHNQLQVLLVEKDLVVEGVEDKLHCSLSKERPREIASH